MAGFSVPVEEGDVRRNRGWRGLFRGRVWNPCARKLRDGVLFDQLNHHRP